MASRRLIACAAVLAAVSVAVAGGAFATTADDVKAYSGVPAFVAPGPAFDAAKARGKTVFVIPAGSQVADLSSVSAFTGGIREAGTAAGVKVTTCSNHGTVKEWAACLDRAIARKANAIVLAGSIDLVALRSPLAGVKEAKIPVVAAHVLAPGDFPAGVDSVYKHALLGLAATVTAPYAQAARLMADFVIATAGGAPTRIVIAGSSDLPESAAMLATVQNELAYACGTACSVSSIDIPYARWQTDAISKVQKATLMKPTQYLIPLFDGVTGLAAQNMADARGASATAIRPDICSFGGGPSAIQQGQAANRVVCDLAENMNWTGWATIDQTLRVLTGNSPVAQNLPVRLLSASTLWPSSNWFAGGMTFPPVVDAGWGDPATTYVAGYRELWGLA